MSNIRTLQATNTLSTTTEETNSPSKELISRNQIEGTPFELIEFEGRAFVALGTYRVTPEFETPEQAMEEFNEPKNFWNLLLTVITSVQDAYHKHNAAGGQNPE